MKNIFFEAFSDGERFSEIDKILNTISQFGAVVETHLFSDISLSMKIEIEERDISTLYNELRQIIKLSELEYLNSNSKTERIIFLNITFSKGTGNLKILTP